MNTSIESGWENLDAWSETYIGARWLIDKKLPEKLYLSSPIDAPLSQMVLIASHQLVEIMLFDCIRSHLQYRGEWNEVMAEVLRKLGFNEAFNKWPKLLTGEAFPKNEQPFSGARLLAGQRNAAVHSESAVTTPEMARSALYTAEMASRAIQAHFGKRSFSYETVVESYAAMNQPWFSLGMLPPKT